MPNFKIATGHNVPLVDLDDFTPYQPLTPGLQYTRRTPLLDGIKEEGPFIRFTFGILTEAQYQALLAQAGLTSALTADVTLYAQNVNYNWQRWNGKARKPALEGRRGFHLRDVPLLITDIHEVT